ncbi:hypothetical protein HDU96_005052 [Phlyctochytrium bullatum]|nr:hypothetical protein HDU96_005052 [Phlyctochytrium bullatum]
MSNSMDGGIRPQQLTDVSSSSASSSKSLTSRSLLGWWRIGHLADYVSCVIILGAGFAIDKWVKPFERPFETTDKEISHPHLPNIVSNVMLLVYAVIVPIAVVGGICGARLLMARMGGGRRPDVAAYAACVRDLHHFIVGLALTTAYTKLVTDFLKVEMGRLRPDFLSRCKYDEALKACTGDASKIEDGRKSFPSGHSSYSFAGCTFLTIHLLGLLEVWPIITGTLGFDVKGAFLLGGPTRSMPREYPVTGRAWRFAVCFLPLFLSSYIGITRLQQYIHHPTDVLFGAFLGILIAIAVHLSRVPEPPQPVPEDDDEQQTSNMAATDATATTIDVASSNAAADKGSSVRNVAGPPRTLFGWWNWNYIVDYVVCAVVVSISFRIDDMKPFERPFDIDDKDLSHPNKPNIVTQTMLVVYALAVPAAVVALIFGIRLAMVRAKGGRKAYMAATASCLRDFHHFLVGLVLAFVYTKLFTDFLKVTMGRLRPDFLSRCQWSTALQACTGDPDKIEDGRKSFPSGHSSYTFAGSTFLTIHLLGLLEVWPVVTGTVGFDVRGALLPGGATRGVPRPYPLGGRAWRFVAAFLPLLLSSYVAISRLQQYIHHPTDVLFGSVLGTLVAIAVHYSRIPEPPLNPVEPSLNVDEDE